MRFVSWGSSVAVTFILFVAACDSEITIPPVQGGGGNDDGAGVATATTGASTTAVSTTGQGGGGGSPGPFTIELTLVSGSAPFGPEEVDPAMVAVFVGKPDGSLKESFWGDQLPIQVEVEVDDVVGYRWDGSSQNLLTTYRITTGVFRIEETVGAPEEPCDVVPMAVTVTLPALAGASAYYVSVDGKTKVYFADPGEHTFDVVDCDGSFDLFAYAAQGNVPVGYELLEAVPFIAGGSMNVPLTLASTEERVIEINASPLDGADGVSGLADWSYGDLYLPAQITTTGEPGGIFLYAPSLISPGEVLGTPRAALTVEFGSDASGACHNSTLIRRGESAAAFAFDPHRLARASGTTGGGWEIVERGELGDVVQIIRAWEQFDWVWQHHQDANAAPAPAILPELPPGVAWPTAQPEYENVAHRDVLEHDGYAAVIRGGQLPPGGETTEHRITFACD